MVRQGDIHQLAGIVDLFGFTDVALARSRIA